MHAVCTPESPQHCCCCAADNNQVDAGGQPPAELFRSGEIGFGSFDDEVQAEVSCLGGAAPEAPLSAAAVGQLPGGLFLHVAIMPCLLSLKMSSWQWGHQASVCIVSSGEGKLQET